MRSKGMGNHQWGLLERSRVSWGHQLCHSSGVGVQSVSIAPTTVPTAHLLSDIWHVVRFWF